MVEVVHKRLVYTVDSSDLSKAANDVQKLGSETQKASAVLAAAKASLPAKEYRALAASMAPAIAAEKDMARVVRETERALKPMVAEQRKIAAEHLKQEAVLQKRILTEQKAAASLRLRHDTEYRNAQAMLKVEADVTRHVEARNLTLEQGNAILAGASARYRQMGQQAQAANQNIRLTGMQVQNLGYQANDVATMLLMGASPFQIIASQGGQVVQALGDGPGGVKGSIAAIGTSIAGLATRIGPVGFALAGATAAAGALWWMSSGSESKEAANSIDEYRGLVDRLQDSYRGVEAAAAGVWERAAIPTDTMALGQLQDAATKAKAELQEARDLLAGSEAVSLQTGTIGAAVAVFELLNGEVREAKGELQDLYGQFTRGEIDARKLADAAARIQIDPAASDRTRALAGEVRQLAEQFGSAAANAQAINAAIDAMTSGKEGRLAGGFLGDLRARFGDIGSALDRMAPETMDELRQGLKDQADALTETDKAATEYAKSLADLRSGWSDSLGDLQRQVEMYGQTEGAIAAARFEHEALAEARKLAADADKLFDENGADAARIRQVADEIGFLTDQLTGMKEAEQQAKRVRDVLADLQFQGSLIGLSDVEADVARQLNTLKLGHESLDGQRIAGQIRYNDSLQKTQDALEKQRDLMSNIVSTGFDALFDTDKSDSFFDSVMDGLADVGGQFTNDISALWKEAAR